MLESAVRVSAEETTNSILVTSSEHDFAAVRDVIARLDKPRRQVYIEAVVMDVGVEKDTGVGVQYHGLQSLGGSGATLYGGMNPFASASQPAAAATSSVTDTTLQALALGIRGPTIEALGMSIPAFGAFIQASTHTLDSDILQTPHILATDNVQAEFHVTVNRSLQQNYPSYSSLSSLAGGTSGAATGGVSVPRHRPRGVELQGARSADQGHAPPERVRRRPPRHRRDHLRHDRRPRGVAGHAPVHGARRDDDDDGSRSADER